ncbi:agmatinase [Lentilitoribacter sp. Alg239-R112]|jgi:agmatinase|uniref:agmatinase n=1 Tax=Lentilitoribacter sp. Alg239-R112 TaxID=2305987 RepID=UPI0013A6DF22|nr:agmatinase [Lentilitoribacter sp. Alg239-R112]
MNKVFLDSELSDQERQREDAKFVIIPMPLERTVSYGSGTRFGPDAILEASDQLERLCFNREICAEGIFTEPSISCDGALADVMRRLSERTKLAVSEGRIPVTLGGEHSLSYGAVVGVQQALDAPVGVVQIDAHADLRKAYQDEKYSHASVMQLLADEDVRLAQFGVRALCREEVDRRLEKHVFHIDAEELVSKSIYEINLPDDFPENIYVSYDVDGLDPSEMPATGTPVPGGLSYFQSIHIVKSALKGRNLVGLDVVELAPIKDMDGWNFTAAQIVYALMTLIK